MRRRFSASVSACSHACCSACVPRWTRTDSERCPMLVLTSGCGCAPK
ncbi:hypothetical protein FOC34_06295 [Burkholderia multivorans]|nr:hypothetical protein FOC34_06295 [Burkholderia multivorans]